MTNKSENGNVVNGNIRINEGKVSEGEIFPGVNPSSDTAGYPSFWINPSVSDENLKTVEIFGNVKIHAPDNKITISNAYIRAYNDNDYNYNYFYDDLYIYGTPEIEGKVQIPLVSDYEKAKLFPHNPNDENDKYKGGIIELDPFRYKYQDSNGKYLVQEVDEDVADKFTMNISDFTLVYEPQNRAIRISQIFELNLYDGDKRIENYGGEDYTSYISVTGKALPQLPAKNKHKFLGWSESQYSSITVNAIEAMETGNKKFYAKWSDKITEPATHTLTLDFNGGTYAGITGYTTDFTEGTEIILADLPRPHRDNYTFAGWYANEDLSGSEVESVGLAETEDITLWAKWNPVTPTEVKHTLTLNPGGGAFEGITGSYITEFTEGTELILTDLPKPQRENYTFGGWYDNEDLSGGAVQSVGLAETEDITLWAKWVINQGTVTVEVKSEEGAPKISSSEQAIKDAALDDSDYEELLKGTDIKLVLAAEITEEPGGKAQLEKDFKCTIGKYTDISLYKYAGGNSEKITQTSKKISITADIPRELLGENKSFFVIRTHGGENTVLEDKDSNPDTVTFETDLFSPYYIAYTQSNPDNPTDPDNPDNPSNPEKPDNPDTPNVPDSTSKIPTITPITSDETTQKPDENNKPSTDNQTTTNPPQSGNNGGVDTALNTGDSSLTLFLVITGGAAAYIFILLYYTTGTYGMTEEKKNLLVEALADWGKKGGKLRRTAAMAAIFMVLLYYYTIGQKIVTNNSKTYWTA